MEDTIIIVPLAVGIAAKILYLILNLIVWPYLNSRKEEETT